MARSKPVRRNLWTLALLALLALPAAAEAANFETHTVLPRALNKTSGPAPATRRQAYARHVRNSQAVAARKAVARQRAASDAGRSSAGSSSRAAGPASIFSGLNGSALWSIDNTVYNQGVPPDSTGAIGPKDYVEIVNSKVAVFPRWSLQGSQWNPKGTADLDTFVGAFGSPVFDPQIQYDPVSKHWFYAATAILPDGAYTAFGWSKTKNPRNLTSGWCRFGVPNDLNSGGLEPPFSFLDDFPKLGHDDRRVVVGTNVYDLTTMGEPFLTARIWTYPKPADYGDCGKFPPITYAGDPQVPPAMTEPLETAGGDTLSTPVPANTVDSSSKTYITAANDASGGTQTKLALVKVGGPGNNPNLGPIGDVTVPGYDVPADVPQPSAGFPLDSLDAELTNAVSLRDPQANGSPAIWTQHTIDGPGGRSALRWYELLPERCNALPDCQANALRQTGTLSDASLFLFNGAISPTMTGDRAVVEYNTGDASSLTEIRAQSRKPSMAKGLMTDEVTLATSDDINQEFSCDDPTGAPCRWGDYSGASPDPKNDRVVWGVNQYMGPNDGPSDDNPAWRTQIFAISSP